MRTLLMTAALTLIPLSVAAESQADRFADLTERMTRTMWGMMANEAEKEGANGDPMRAAIEKFEWTPALATATDCMLDRYNTAIGSDAVDEMFDRMDGMITQMDGMTLTEFTDEISPEDLMPEGLTEDQTLEINEACGMTDAQLAMMSETGFTAAMMGAMAATQ